MRVSAVLLASAAVVAVASASCLNLPTIDSVSLPHYLGGWYEIATTADFRATFDYGLQCTTANYSLNADGTVKVDNSGNYMSTTGTRKVAIGTAEQVSGGKLRVTFTPLALNIWSPYWIVQLYGQEGTGYEAAVIYSCNEVLGITVNTIWILSRTPTLPADYSYDTVVAKIESLGLNTTALGLSQTVQSSSCVY